MRSASAQAATAGPGLGCSPMPKRCHGRPAAAGLVPGRRANFAPRLPRRSGDSVRAMPASHRPRRPRPPPWLRSPRRRFRPRDARPSAAKLLRAPRPPASASAPAPSPGSEARAPLGRPGPAAPRASFPLLAAPAPRPSLLLPADSSRAARRRGRGCSLGPPSPAPSPGTPPPGPSRSERRGLGREGGCGGVGGQAAALPRAGMGLPCPQPPHHPPGPGLSPRMGPGGAVSTSGEPSD